MPIYEFECKECNARFEVIKLTREESPKAECRECGSSRTERLLSSFSAANCLKSSCEASGPACSVGGGT